MAIDTTNEELLGSQRRAANLLCGPKNIKRFISFCRKFLGQRKLQVTNLNVYLNLTIEEDKIAEVRFGETIMVPCIREKAKVVRMAFLMSRSARPCWLASARIR